MESSGTTTSPKDPRNSATFSKKPRKTATTDNAGQDSSAVLRRAKRHSRRSRRSSPSKRSLNIAKNKVASSDKEDEEIASSSEEEEKVEVEKKISALKKIVPGGETLGVDKLFEETAGYIMDLQYQVKALKFLASFVEGSDKEKRKFGG